MKDLLASPLKPVEQDLRQIEQDLLTLLQRRGGPVQIPGAQIFRSGGKRLRPALVLLSSRIFGPQPQEALSIAGAVEMVHGASLLHDDVIDETQVRRGRATMNSMRGNRYTVLLGDFLLTQALEAVCRVGQVRLVQVVSEAVAEMTLGQIQELEHQGRPETGIQAYLEIVNGKTASLMAAACALGALLGRASEGDVQALGRYGRNLGLAFQMVDDILDYWGDPEVLGKPVGSDLAEEKYTLPFLLAYQAAGPAERAILAGPARPSGATERTDFPEILALMDSLGAREASLARARQHASQALEDLRELPGAQARDLLAELPHFILSRDH